MRLTERFGHPLAECQVEMGRRVGRGEVDLVPEPGKIQGDLGGDGGLPHAPLAHREDHPVAGPRHLGDQRFERRREGVELLLRDGGHRMLRNKRRIVQRPEGRDADEPEGQKRDIDTREC